MSISSECSSYIPPDSGAFPVGYCIWKNTGRGAPIPIENHCASGFDCPPEDLSLLREALVNTFEGECFNLTCSPASTGFRTLGQPAYPYGYDPELDDDPYGDDPADQDKE